MNATGMAKIADIGACGNERRCFTGFAHDVPRAVACGSGGAICFVGAGCRQWSHKKPDPSKGAVTGVVICEDTGKPARFANVVLTRAPEKDVKFNVSEALPAAELTVSDLDGRFRLEAVEPGRYYAYAVLDGYLDPAKSIDIKQVLAMPDEKSRATEAIRQWKDHLADVTVGVNRVAEVTIPIERQRCGTARYGAI